MSLFATLTILLAAATLSLYAVEADMDAQAERNPFAQDRLRDGLPPEIDE